MLFMKIIIIIALYNLQSIFLSIFFSDLDMAGDTLLVLYMRKVWLRKEFNQTATHLPYQYIAFL